MKRGRPRDTRQLSLEGYFEVARPPEPTPGALNFDVELRGALKKAIKESGIDRDDIAAAMTMLLGADEDGFRVTKAILDSFTAPSRGDWKFPLLYLPAFIKATGAVWLLDLIAEKCGCKMLVGEEALLAKWGALELQEQRIRTEKARLKKALPPDAAERILKSRGGCDA